MTRPLRDRSSADRERSAPRRLNRALRPYWRSALGFSVVTNALMLVTPIYMLQIYDRVMVSGSIDTLIWISLIAIFLMVIYAAAESGRRRALAAAGDRLETLVRAEVFAAAEQNSESRSTIAPELTKLSQVQQLFTTQALTPLFDLPFAPLFIVLLFIIHPVLGTIGLCGAALVVALTVLAEFVTRSRSESVTEHKSAASAIAVAMDRHKDAIAAMGMSPTLRARHDVEADRAARLSLSTAGAEGDFSSAVKSARQALQVLILGFGAALALSQQISIGTIVAGSIVLARALGPIDQIVGSWRTLTRGRAAWRALKSEVLQRSRTAPLTPLPRPAISLHLDRMAFAPPGSPRGLVEPFNLTVKGGALISVVGGVGAGKSTFLRTLAGAWPSHEGGIKLGGVDMANWPQADRGRHVGYVPQSVQLFPGSIKENVARFGVASDQDIYKALEAAGAVETAISLPNGLDTQIDALGHPLSGGQAQLIALARALFTKPVLLALDEPSANLDPNAAGRLIETLQTVARSGTIVFAATHDIRLLRASDSVLVIGKQSVTRMTPSEFLSGAGQAPVRIAASEGESR